MLIWIVAIPILGAFLTYLVGRFHKTARDYLADLIVILEVIVLASFGTKIWSGEVWSYQLADFCGRGLSLKLDGFRFLYGMVTAVMWMMTTIFSKEYFQSYRNRNRYYLFTLLTFGATMGVFLSADLFTTFIFFEIMSFTSYVWVAQDEKQESLKAAETYLAVAVIGGMVMLMGLFLLYYNVGTLDMDQLPDACKACANKMGLYIAGGCMLFGFGAKAGMFPLHIWLPKAHPVAPAPASALLSGILTKSGIFGILVISSRLFFGDQVWGTLVLWLGAITMLMGAVLAVFSVNLKRALACSSMSQIGFILTGIGMQGLLGAENALAVRGTILHMVNHSLIKLVLFMAAGVIYFNLHKLDLNEIRGFGRRKPALMVCFLFGALSIGGIPLESGYISKTLLHESILEGGQFVVEKIFLLTGGLTVAYMTKLFVAVFIERNENQEKMDASNKQYMNFQTTFALVGSAVLLPILGLLPNQVMNPLASLGQGFVFGSEPVEAVSYYSLTNLKGAVISILIGVIVYFGFIRICLMTEGEDGRKEYRNYWPDWLDLENLVYRPVLQHMIPFLLAFICRCFDKLVDGIVYFLQKVVFCEAKERKPIPYGNRVTYCIGMVLDGVVFLLNHTICRRKPLKRRFVVWTTNGYMAMVRTSRLAARSVSFGLMMFSVGLLVTLIYLLSSL